MWNINGVLVQGLKDRTNMVKNFAYHGMSAYYQFPLADFSEKECRNLTEQQRSMKISENEYISLEFISDKDLYMRYIKNVLN